MTAAPTHLSLWIDLAVAALITASFVAMSFALLKERHRDCDAWHVHAGAAIYGALFGAVIGFFLMPLRIALMSGELPPGVAGPSGLGAIALIIAMRRGWIARAPFLGPQVRAYRRASLRRSIEAAERQLEKLSARDEKRLDKAAGQSSD